MRNIESDHVSYAEPPGSEQRKKLHENVNGNPLDSVGICCRRKSSFLSNFPEFPSSHLFAWSYLSKWGFMAI